MSPIVGFSTHYDSKALINPEYWVYKLFLRWAFFVCPFSNKLYIGKS